MIEYLRIWAASIALCSLVLGGCGLFASDEERISSAHDKMSQGSYRAAMIDLKNVLSNDSENVEARLLLSQVSLGLGDIDAAEKEIERAAELGATAARIIPLKLAILLARNNFNAVLELLVAEDSPLSPVEELGFRGQALLGLRNWDKALEVYDDLLELVPQSADASTGRAAALAGVGRTDESVTALQSLLKGDPASLQARVLLARLYFAQGQFSAAEDAYAVALNHSTAQVNTALHLEILRGLTESRLAEGRAADAARSLQELTRLAGDQPVTLFLAARLARQQDDLAAAAADLQRLLNLVPDHPAASLMLAQTHIMRGNPAQAESLLERILALAPSNMMARKILAELKLQSGAPGDVISLLNPVAAEQDADVYRLLAQASLMQGDTEAMIGMLESARSHAPEDVDAQLNLAAAYLAAGRTDDASALLESLPSTGEHDLRREQIGLLLLLAEGRRGEAFERLSAIVRERVSDEPIVVLAANLYISDNQRDKAKDVLQRHIAVNGAAGRSRILLGEVYLSEGSLEAATDVFNAASSASESRIAATLGLARIAEHRDDFELAERYFREASDAEKSTGIARAMLAAYLLRRDRLKDAEALANELIAGASTDARVHAIAGEILAAAGRYDDALNQFRRARQTSPGNLRLLTSIAGVNLALGNTVAARSALQEVLEIDRDSTEAKSMLVGVELQQGRADAAQQLVAELQASDPANFRYMALEAALAMRERNFDAAIRAFDRAIAAGGGRDLAVGAFRARVAAQRPRPEQTLERWLVSNPDDLATRTLLAQYQQQRGDESEAMAAYEEILVADPDNVIALNNVAWAYQQQGNLDRATQLAERAYRIAPENGSVVDTLAWIYRGAGRLDDSERLLRAATELSPGSAEIRYHLAAVLAQTGSADEARVMLEKVLTDDASFSSRDEALKLLNSL